MPDFEPIIGNQIVAAFFGFISFLESTFFPSGNLPILWPF